MRSPRIALSAVAVVALGTGCGGTSKPPSVPPNGVLVANFAFTPQNLTVHVGDTVTWVFDQPDAPHNVVSLNGPGSFNSGVPQGKGTFTHTFTVAGTYTYDCEVHPNMTGSIVVGP